MFIFWPFFQRQFFPLKIFLFFPKYKKSCFLIEFRWKAPIRKTSIFGQNPWTMVLVKTLIFRSYNVCFLSRISKKDFFWHPYEKFLFLDKIHGLTPLKNSHFFALVKIKIILFFSQYQKRCFLIWFLWKRQIRESSIFGQNPWTNPFGKCPFFGPF